MGQMASQISGASKSTGVLAATYSTGPWSFTTQIRWFGSAILNNAWNTGNQATAATRCTVPDSVFNIDPTTYLDLRVSCNWNNNWQLSTISRNYPRRWCRAIPAASGRTAVPSTRSRNTTFWAARSAPASASTSRGVQYRL